MDGFLKGEHHACPGGALLTSTCRLAMKNWCAVPSRCVELTTGGKISCGQCAAVDPPREDEKSGGSTTTTAFTAGATSRTTSLRPSVISTRTTTAVTVVPTTDSSTSAAILAASTRPPASIARSTLISTTDSDGRPMLSLAVQTIANPDLRPTRSLGEQAIERQDWVKQGNRSQCRTCGDLRVGRRSAPHLLIAPFLGSM